MSTNDTTNLSSTTPSSADSTQNNNIKPLEEIPPSKEGATPASSVLGEISSLGSSDTNQANPIPPVEAEEPVSTEELIAPPPTLSVGATEDKPLSPPDSTPPATEDTSNQPIPYPQTESVPPPEPSTPLPQETPPASEATSIQPEPTTPEATQPLPDVAESTSNVVLPEESISAEELIAPPPPLETNSTASIESSTAAETTDDSQPKTYPQTPPAPPVEATQPNISPVAPSPPFAGAMGGVPPSAPAAAIIKRSNRRFPKIILYFLAILIAAGVIFFIFFFRATVNINPTPVPDKITIDGKTVSAGQYKLIPGEHKINISKDGYISFNLDKKFSIGEKLNLAFIFIKISQPTLLDKGSTLVQLSSDNKLVEFVSGNGNFAAINPTDPKNTIQALSNKAYPGVKQALFSKLNDFVFFFDNDGLKILDFAKTDLINQTETKLPPAVSGISSIAWNGTASQYYSEANSEILYDFKTSYGYSLIGANRNHTQSEILMQIDPKRFTSFQMDWSQSARDIIMAGGELGTLNIATRQYSKISDGSFVLAKWGPDGKNAFVQDKDGKLYKYSDGKLTDLNIVAGLNQVTFVSQNEIIAISNKAPVKINFDTGATINYAEIAGLSNAKSIAVAEDKIYLIDSDGLKVAAMTENKY